MASLIEAARGAGLSRRDRARRSRTARTPAASRARARPGIATAVVDHKAFPDREAFERGARRRACAAHGIELVCLAGFMRVLTPGFVERWAGRMLNIHPSLLPALPGLAHPSRGRSRPACASTAARCISWCRSSMPARSSPRPPCRSCPATRDETLAARVLAQEHVLYPRALRMVARAPRGSKETGSSLPMAGTGAAVAAHRIRESYVGRCSRHASIAPSALARAESLKIPLVR